MGKRFIISEEEKSSIRGLYRLDEEDTTKLCTEFNTESKTLVVDYQDILNAYSASTEEETFKIINTKIEEVAKTLVDKGIPDRTACEAGLIYIRPGFKDKKYMTVVDPNYHTIYSFDQNLNDVTPYLDPNQKNPIPIITGKESDLVPTGRIKDFVNLSQFDQYKWVTAMKKLSKKFEDVTDEDWKSITEEDKKNYPVTVNDLFSVLGSTTVYPQIFSTEPGKIKLYGGDKYPEGKNKFDIAFLKTLNGTLLSNAIHRMLNKPERVQAFANAFKRTSKTVDEPSDYLNLSLGCINVPYKIYDNETFREILRNSWIFYISPEKVNYYVQSIEQVIDNPEKCYSPDSLGVKKTS